MSLESAGFIKDLVPTNPEGTDPKSQGDDHLRMLKAVLKAQFAGMTQGKAINLTEDQLNAAVIAGMAGLNGRAQQITDLNALTDKSGFYGLTGTVLNGWPTAVQGDMLIHIAWDNVAKFQIGLGYTNGYIFARASTVGGWSTWWNFTPPGTLQTWQTMGAARLLNTNYTNAGARPITVSVSCQANLAQATFIDAIVGGVVVARTSVAESNGASFIGLLGNVYFTVPPGAVYQVAASQSSGIAMWVELR